MNAPIVHRLPGDYRWATAYEAETWYWRHDAIQVVRGGDRHTGYFTDIAVPSVYPEVHR